MTSLSRTATDTGEALHQRQRWQLPDHLQGRLADAVDDWRAGDKTNRLWRRDASLWTGGDESNWLGWLTIAAEQLGSIDTLLQFADEVQEAGFQQILLLGMGGSSLCPEVLAATFGRIASHAQFLMLDSTDPAQIHRFASQIDFRKTLFIVSSKSGTTLEVNSLKEFFYAKAKRVVGPSKVGARFIAITDPDSELHRVAEAERFRRVFFGSKSIGGRFSALSNFGMVPGAAMGIDIKTFLARTQQMAYACSSFVPLDQNPGVILGLILGVACSCGRDKVTLVTSPGIWDLGVWIEQLLAESLGKLGKGLIPVDQEDLGGPNVYGDDRIFCYVRHRESVDFAHDAGIEALANDGQPVVIIDLESKYDLGQEFFRWEIATATAGSVLGINPFDQPDVEASKIATRRLTVEYESNGSLPAEPALTEGGGLKLFTDERNAHDLSKLAQGDTSITAFLKAHLQRLRANDYLALLAFVDMNDEHRALLQAIRHAVRERCKVATSLGFGPRYLHSTGQTFKGGPSTGVFIQVTCDDAVDLPVPGHKYTFGVIKAAQARGDFSVLAERGRRALRVHVGTEVERGLCRLCEHISEALK